MESSEGEVNMGEHDIQFIQHCLPVGRYVWRVNCAGCSSRDDITEMLSIYRDGAGTHYHLRCIPDEIEEYTVIRTRRG